MRFSSTQSHLAVSIRFLILFSFIALSLNSTYGQTKVYFNRSSDKIQRANVDGSALEDLILARLNSPTDITIDPVSNEVYWSESGKIMRMDRDSGRVELIIEFPPDGAFTTVIAAIALDLTNNKLYWINGAEAAIQRSNLDGTNIEDVVISSVSNSLSIAVDAGNQKVYWSGTGGYIRRANFDGTGIEDVVTSGVFEPSGITLDLVNNQIYWADLVANEISRANLDGSNAEEVITSDLENPADIVLNDDKSEIFWLDKGSTGAEGTLQQANIDGSSVTNFVTGMDDPVALTIDVSNNDLLWLDDPSLEPAYIGRIGTDGANQEIIIEELGGFENFSLNETEQSLYWIDQSSSDIFKANLDGSQLERVVETVTGSDFAFDFGNQRIYWTENDAIRRANFDGTTVQDLVTSNVDEPDFLVLDVAANKMYWVDGGFDADRIKWANLDGSENTDLITGLDAPLELRLDVDHGKLYWLEGGSFATELRRANKDGTTIEDLVSEGAGINSYKLLSANNRLFWTSRDVFAANLDGSAATTIVDQSNTGLSGAPLASLTIDADMAKLYWNDDDFDENTIWRANWDGSNLEDVISGLPSLNDRRIVVFGETASSVESEPEMVEDYMLAKAYPNPFNATTTIRFSLPTETHVELTIYNSAGQEVMTLVNAVRRAGTHSVNFTADNLPTGIYFARMQATHFVQTRKITLLK